MYGRYEIALRKEPPDPFFIDSWSAPVDTVTDLVSELERQMVGIKDKHDIFMEKFYDSLRNKVKADAKDSSRWRRVLGL